MSAWLERERLERILTVRSAKLFLGMPEAHRFARKWLAERRGNGRVLKMERVDDSTVDVTVRSVLGS